MGAANEGAMAATTNAAERAITANLRIVPPEGLYARRFYARPPSPAPGRYEQRHWVGPREPSASACSACGARTEPCDLPVHRCALMCARDVVVRKIAAAGEAQASVA